MERLFVFGFTCGDQVIVLAAPDLEYARAMAFENFNLEPNTAIEDMNHCQPEWRDEVMIGCSNMVMH
jgi:hypothetical protein